MCQSEQNGNTIADAKYSGCKVCFNPAKLCAACWFIVLSVDKDPNLANRMN